MRSGPSWCTTRKRLSFLQRSALTTSVRMDWLKEKNAQRSKPLSARSLKKDTHTNGVKTGKSVFLRSPEPNSPNLQCAGRRGGVTLPIFRVCAKKDQP